MACRRQLQFDLFREKFWSGLPQSLPRLVDRLAELTVFCFVIG
jgi:hypothetical protein